MHMLHAQTLQMKRVTQKALVHDVHNSPECRPECSMRIKCRYVVLRGTAVGMQTSKISL